MQEIVNELKFLSEKKKQLIVKIKEAGKSYIDFHAVRRINNWTNAIIEIEIQIDALLKILSQISSKL